MTLHLTQSYTPHPQPTLHLRLHNLGDAPLAPTSFCYTSLARIDEGTTVTGGTVVENVGSFVSVVPDDQIPAGCTWTLSLAGLAYAPQTRSQGVLSAWVVTKDGVGITATIDDLDPQDGADRGPGKIWPAGQVTSPLGLLPWPAAVTIDDWDNTIPTLYPATGTDPRPFQTIAALHRRLFPAEPAPFALTQPQHGRAVTVTADPALAAGTYTITFGDQITVHHADPAALLHGLTALAQIGHHARIDPRFRFPAHGTLSDHPRFAWRGLMFDVVRNFFPVSTITRMLDIMAWLRMNRFHWHLTDDEAWRMPSAAYPALNTTGAKRGMGRAMPPQYGDGPTGQEGFYTSADIGTVLSHATTLGITVMPEVEMPGHAASLIASVPGLRDPDEPNGCYRSIQGHPNNALNPGLPKTYEVTQTLLDEAAALFPGEIIHVGADEVELSAWTRSPAAQTFAAAKGLSGTHEMQAHFLRHVQGYLARINRKIGAWDEAAEGGGIAPDTAVLFAWRTKERIAELIRAGYTVVATPGQAYYLDMVEAPGWDARGISWAGASTPENTYRYEPAGDLPDGPGRLLGVQAAIWSEYLRTPAAVNAMAFPRLAAVAESAWTPPSAKSWDRFCALSRLIPQL